MRHDYRDNPADPDFDRGPLPVGWLVALLVGVVFWLVVIRLMAP